MKTPEKWSDVFWHDTTRPFREFVASIQADAREGMVPAVELRPTIELLQWLDRRGGLGLDVHDRLRDHIDRLETLLSEKGGK